MSIKPLSVIVVAAAIICTLSPSEAMAQRGRPGWNQLTRFLGGGHSAGYHWRTPGPAVGYYNPYSHHNSRLRTGGVPQGAGPYVARLAPDCRQQFYDSGFDQPSGFNGHGGMMMAPGASPNMVDAQIDDSDEDVEESIEDAIDGDSILDDPTSIDDPTSGEDPFGDAPDVDGSGARGAVDESALWPGFHEFGRATQPRVPNQRTVRYSTPQVTRSPVYNRRGAALDYRFK